MEQKYMITQVQVLFKDPLMHLIHALHNSEHITNKVTAEFVFNFLFVAQPLFFTKT